MKRPSALKAVAKVAPHPKVKQGAPSRPAKVTSASVVTAPVAASPVVPVLSAPPPPAPPPPAPPPLAPPPPAPPVAVAEPVAAVAKPAPPVAVAEPVVAAAKPAPAVQPAIAPETPGPAPVATPAASIASRAAGEPVAVQPPAVGLARVPTAPAPRGFSTGGLRTGPAGMSPPRPLAPAENFVEGDHVVYPTHGVGKIERIVTESIAGYRLELIHITFEENRMTLRVPVEKARSAGLRKLASRQLFDAALTTLRGRARIKRTMWSRRAQEYEAKINSGDPLAIAEVVRDLHRNAGQPDQSFSERQIYEAAVDRLAAELAALDDTDKATAAEKLTAFMKAP
ncbi:MAG: CarD family transcriptional regulator [Acetobacteraceae bacterium]